MTGTEILPRGATVTEVTQASPPRADARPRAPDLEARQILDRVGAALFGADARATGRYEILGKLGAGGMGVVYVAHDPLLDCKVALKQLHPHLVAEHGLLERLRTEARAMARLRSERHVVTLYDFFVQDDVVFVVMELVEGATLRAWQARPRSWGEVVDMYIQAGLGLAAAHRAGLSHRDFKPENVLVDLRGVAKVGDFGLARADRSRGKTLEDIGDPALTRAGTVVGTPRYMAPEQLRGGSVDARGDQFSFCVALWEALFKEHPFFPMVGAPSIAAGHPPTSSTFGPTGAPLPVAFSHAILGGALRPLPAGHKVPRHVVRALVRGLGPDPHLRFPTMDELLAALRGSPGRARTLALGVAALALAAALGGRLAAAPPPTPPPTRAELEADATARIAADLALPQAPPDSHMTAALARYRSRWAAQQADQAFALQQRPGDPSATTRLRCLEDARRTAANLAAGLRAAPTATSWHAVELVEGLPAPEECGHMPREWLACSLELAGLTADDAAAPAFAASAAALRREAAGDYAAALGHAEDALRRADVHGHPVLRAQVGYQLGRLRYLVGDAEAAVQALADARAAAEPTGCLDLRGRIYSRLIKVTAMYPSLSADAAEEWSRLQEILARATPDGGERLADAHNERGLLRLLRGHDPAGALQELEQAVRSREPLLGGRPSTDLAESYLNIGLAQHQLGHLDAAELALAEATRLRAAVVGPEHPLHYKEDLARGQVLTDRGDFPAAIASLERARMRVEDGLGRASRPRARVLLALARAQQAAGRGAAASRLAAEAAAAATATDLDPSEAVELRAAALGLAATQGDPTATTRLAALADAALRDPRVALETLALVAQTEAELAYNADDLAAAASHAARALSLLARAGLREGDAAYGAALRLRGLAAHARGDLARACELLRGLPVASAAADALSAQVHGVRRACHAG